MNKQSSLLELARPVFSLGLDSYAVAKTTNRGLVNHFIVAHHSSNPLPVPGFRVAFLVYDKNTSRVAAVATFGRPIARKEDQKITLELTRLVHADGVPRNLGSWALAKMRKWIRVYMPEIRRLITYQNVDAHDGALYKADNWELVYHYPRTWGNWSSHGDRKSKIVKNRAKWEYWL